MAAVRTPRYTFVPARAAGMLRIRKTPDHIDSYLDRIGYVPSDGLWGEIEDYILENTRSTQRICVFTGPVLRNGDPLIHGVKIPLRFWKVVAFLHPATSEFAATGYVSSQATEVAGLRVLTVFGDVENTQRPIAAIEKLAGVRFAKLKAADVLRGASPSSATRLRDVRDIMLE